MLSSCTVLFPDTSASSGTEPAISHDWVPQQKKTSREEQPAEHLCPGRENDSQLFLFPFPSLGSCSHTLGKDCMGGIGPLEGTQPALQSSAVPFVLCLHRPNALPCS